MTTPCLMAQTDKDWHLLKKRLLSCQHYNIPSLSAFSTAQAGLVYNHDEQTLNCSDCDLLLRDVTTHFDAFALHSACDLTKRCSYLNRYRSNPTHLSGKVLIIKISFLFILEQCCIYANLIHFTFKLSPLIFFSI